jgi:hypothetical protein
MKLYELFEESIEKDSSRQRCSLFEHKLYKRIPGTSASYREDPGNTNTMTQKHAHAYAKPDGRGKELYSVNLDGSGHDGSSGTPIPKPHADYFRGKGYDMPDDNILESWSIENLDPKDHSLIVLFG